MHDVQRVGIVLETLAHFESVFGQHEAVDDDVLESGLFEERGGEHHQGVEPAAGLVEPFGDELRREVALELGFVLKRIVLLRVRHGTGLEPAVEHFGGALVGFAVFFNKNVVEHMLVQVFDFLS